MHYNAVVNARDGELIWVSTGCVVGKDRHQLFVLSFHQVLLQLQAATGAKIHIVALQACVSFGLTPWLERETSAELLCSWTRLHLVG